MPVERAFLPEIDIANQQNCDIKHHFQETKDSGVRMAGQIFENESPGVQEDGFHVKENEHHGDQVKLHGKRFAGVAGGRNAAFIGLHLGFIRTAPANESGEQNQRTGQSRSNEQVYE